MKKTLKQLIYNGYFLIAVAVLLCLSLLGGIKGGSQTVIAGVFLTAVYVALALVFAIVSKKKRLKKADSALSENITLDLLMNFSMPVSILDENGGIIWYNKKFSDGAGNNVPLYGMNINDLLEQKLSANKLKSFLSSNEREILSVMLSGTSYDVTSYKISSADRSFAITVWYDMTLVEGLKNELKMKNPVVAYIAVDNFEAAGHMQKSYRTITAQISAIIKEWAENMNGIVREYERDKYIAVFEEKYAEQLFENKFDVLDAVRNASGDEDIPITVSVGMACVDGNLIEKEKVASQAFDLALQRGGDQAVVKGRESTEFYGGRTKTVQKRTKIRSRIIASELVGMIKNSRNVLIMGHKNADHDSIGSCLGIARLALDFCEKVNIIVNINDVNLKGVFQKLRGVKKYDNVFIDAVAAQELIEHDTLLIVTDANNSAIFEAPDVYKNCQNVVIIDHHRKTGEFVAEPKITYIEPSASSASELVAEILEQVTSPGTLLKEEAEVLFSGIVLDTKNFTRNTGVRTFSAALYLRSEGASPTDAQSLFKSSLDEFMREAKFESNVIVYKNKIAISVFDGEATAGDRISAAKAADRLLGVEGVLAAFTLCMIDDTVHISARSTGSVNVQLILEKLNGGGHFDAAGAQLQNMPMTSALTMLKNAIDEYLNN